MVDLFLGSWEALAIIFREVGSKLLFFVSYEALLECEFLTCFGLL